MQSCIVSNSLYILLYSLVIYCYIVLYGIHNNVIFSLLIVLTVLGSCALSLSIINSVINCESFQVITIDTLEVTTLDFVSKNIAKSAN